MLAFYLVDSDQVALEIIPVVRAITLRAIQVWAIDVNDCIRVHNRVMMQHHTMHQLAMVAVVFECLFGDIAYTAVKVGVEGIREIVEISLRI